MRSEPIRSKTTADPTLNHLTNTKLIEKIIIETK